MVVGLQESLLVVLPGVETLLPNEPREALVVVRIEGERIFQTAFGEGGG